MRYSSLVERIAGPGSDAWAVSWQGRQRRDRGEDIIFLSVGDPDFPTPAPIVERAVAALREGDTHYAAIDGRPDLRAAVAERFRTTNDLPTGSVTAENVVVMGGTQNALFGAALCVLDHGDEIVVPDPAYVTYDATLSAGGAKVVPAPTGAGFRLDLDAVARAVTPRTRALMITSPNNPTGVVATDDELEGVAQLAIDNDLWVLADEVYADLVYDGRHRSVAAIPGMADRTVVVSSLSKSHAMTGWRCGWLVGPAPLAAHATNLALPMMYGLPGFVQQAALEALARADEVTAEMRDVYRRRRDLAVAELATNGGLDVVVPEGGMYVMVDVRGCGMSSLELTWALLDRKGVATLDGGAFGARSDGWLRLAFTVGDEEIVEGCRRLVELHRELASTGPAGNGQATADQLSHEVG